MTKHSYSTQACLEYLRIGALTFNSVLLCGLRAAFGRVSTYPQIQVHSLSISAICAMPPVRVRNCSPPSAIGVVANNMQGFYLI